jgi:hypothetical protein
MFTSRRTNRFDWLTQEIHEQEKWDRHLACPSWLTGWKPIPQADA